MNLLKKTKKPYKLFLICIVVCFLTFPKNKNFISGIIFSIYDEISAYDSGFSSFKNLYGGSYFSFENNLNVIKKTPKILLNILFGLDDRKQIPKLHLDIKFKNYKRLLEDRIRSVKNEMGSDFTEVKGVISFEGKRSNCKVRLKGDLSQHWRSEKRMSFRIKLKGDNSILSFKRFSIHKPSARQHPYDQTFQDLQKELGNISSSHNYVNLFVNGIDWGIMNIEEHMSKEFLEKQELKESLIFKLGNEKNWLYKKKNKGNLYDAYRLSDAYLNVDVFQDEKYLIDSTYRKYYSYISNEIIKKESKIFDLESFSKSLILSLIWNTVHTLYGSNSRYYFNPYDLKIYPITTDQAYFSPFLDKLDIPKPYEKVIYSSDFYNGYDSNLVNVKNSLNESKKILNKWQQYFPLDKKKSTSILRENLKHFNSYNKFENSILKSDLKKESLHKKITNVQTKSLIDHISAKHFDNGEIHIYNLLNEKLKIKNICVGDQLIKDYENNYVEGHNFEYKPYIIKTSLIGCLDNKIEIQTELNGSDRLYTSGYTILRTNTHNPLNSSHIPENLGFLELTDNGNYFIKKGEWKIDKPIVLDKGLEIEKGSELTFKENSYLIVKGGLIINGTNDEKVIMKSDNGPWKGIYVLNSNEKSVIKNSSFFNLTNLNDGLLNLTGGISFYKADVEIKNVKFIKNDCEDFLNIIQSNYSIENVLFENCSSDAFDSDFSTGVISNSKFKNISGDGIDFSGSNVGVISSTFINVKDKAVSVGEASNLNIKSILVQNSGVGVAVKDGSYANVEDSNFINYKLNALMTYKKKSFYSIPKLISKGNIFEDENNCCLSQINSQLINNKIKVVQKSFDVDSLYQTQIMKK